MTIELRVIGLLPHLREYVLYLVNHVLVNGGVHLGWPLPQLPLNRLSVLMFINLSENLVAFSWVSDPWNIHISQG